jgi:hypothetical protein
MSRITSRYLSYTLALLVLGVINAANAAVDPVGPVGTSNLLEVLKYGAIGISLACLLLAFWNNQALAARASALPEKVLHELLSHARWTMKYSFACLMAAIVIEVIGRYDAPIELSVGIVPSNLDVDAKRIRSLPEISSPVRLQVGTETFDLPNGSLKVRVGPNTTLLIYVDGIWSAVKDLDGIVYGQQQIASGRAGTLEPKQ